MRPSIDRKKKKSINEKRNGIAFLLGIATLNYIDTRLKGADEKTAKARHEKEIDMLIKQYERLLKEIENETRDQSETN